MVDQWITNDWLLTIIPLLASYYIVITEWRSIFTLLFLFLLIIYLLFLVLLIIIYFTLSLWTLYYSLELQ